MPYTRLLWLLQGDTVQVLLTKTKGSRSIHRLEKDGCHHTPGGGPFQLQVYRPQRSTCLIDGDVIILRRSNITKRLQAIVDELGHVVTLYGDGVYPRTDLLHRPL